MQTETKVMIGVGIASILILVGGSYFYSKSLAPSPDITKNSPALIHGGDNVIKALHEKVTLVEFGDFECPACKAGNPALKQLLADPKYKDTVTYVWRTFPLHGHSVQASRAAFIVKELSGDPHKFFDMGDLLFEKQEQWSTESGATNQSELFATYAQSLGVDGAKFKELFSTNKYENLVEKDRQDANTLGTNVTPSFYVDGRLVQGTDIAKLKAYIEEELKK